MNTIAALGGGIAGACTITLLHETTRQLTPEAPRMDILGMRSIAKILRMADTTPPADDKLHDYALVGDLLSNAAYYSLTGSGKNVWIRGAGLGLLAGIGALALPGPLGLGEAPSNRSTQTQVMTVALYLVGGLAAAAASSLLNMAAGED
jgi:hypothetical protein